jgi:hypothetical protein
MHLWLYMQYTPLYKFLTAFILMYNILLTMQSFALKKFCNLLIVQILIFHLFWVVIFMYTNNQPQAYCHSNWFIHMLLQLHLQGGPIALVWWMNRSWRWTCYTAQRLRHQQVIGVALSPTSCRWWPHVVRRVSENHAVNTKQALEPRPPGSAVDT